MITTIIVDDELWVCQLIKRIVKWEDLDFHIIGEAHDGNEAFELVKAKKPDIVITDIRMPGFDGISLIKNVKELGLDTKFIIISGYSDFGYAKDALRYGALGYLLKPIDRKELTDLLTSVRSSVFSQREKVVEEELAKGKLAHSLNQLKEKFFLNFLFSDVNKREELHIDKFNQEYESNFKFGYFQVDIFKIDYKNCEQVNESTEAEVLDNIQQIISSEFEHICFDMATAKLNNQVLCILNYNPLKDFTIRNSIHSAFDKIRNSIPLMRDFDLTAGIGSSETDFNFLPRSYSWAENSIKARVTLGGNQVIDISKYVYKHIELKELFPIEKEKKIALLLEVLDNKAAETLITEVFSIFSHRGEVNPCLIFDLSYEIVEIFYKVMRRIDIRIEKEYVGKGKVYHDIGECKSVNQIIDCFIKLFDGARNFYNSLKQNQNRKAIEMVKSYICDHYREEISLNEVANLVFLNSKYLGELFKKETGINFSDYLINYRLDIAKELLKDIRYRTNEVAEFVGYKDAKHFSKLFKKNIGVNPAEYKKMFA